MSLTIEHGTVIHGEDGSHTVSLPGCEEIVHLPRHNQLPVCTSCNRELASSEEIADLDPTICVFCYIR
jgi:hypothetical protein